MVADRLSVQQLEGVTQDRRDNFQTLPDPLGTPWERDNQGVAPNPGHRAA